MDEMGGEESGSRDQLRHEADEEAGERREQTDADGREDRIDDGGSGGAAEEEDETAKRRKKARRSYLQAGGGADAGRKSPVAKRHLTRTMSEWQETCRHLRLPTESEQFCDFVLVFDEIVDEDIADARNRSGCCNCCGQSPKELQECAKVSYTAERASTPSQP